MATKQEAPTNAGHDVLSGLRKRLHSPDYSGEELTGSNNSNNNTGPPPQSTQNELDYPRTPKKPRTTTETSTDSTTATKGMITSQGTDYKAPNSGVTFSKAKTSSKSATPKSKSRTTTVTKSRNSRKQQQCQHPKHSIYELSTVATANININNKSSTNKKSAVNKNKRKQQKNSKGEVYGDRLYNVYKRFEGLFNIGSDAVMCRRCLHRTDRDPEVCIFIQKL